MPVISMISPWIHPKTGVLWFRAKVPKDLQAVAGRNEVKWTLGTKDKAVAAKRWPQDLQKWEAMKAGWRRELERVSLTPDRAREIAAGWGAWIASGATLDRAGVSVPVPGEPWEAFNARVAAHAEEALRLADISVTTDTMPVLVEALGPLVFAAYQQAEARERAAADGLPPVFSPLPLIRAAYPDVATPRMPGEAPGAAPATLDELWKAWAQVATVGPRTKEETRGVLRNLGEFLGHDDGANVTRDDLIRWRQAEKARGLNNNTWNSRVSMVGQVFKHALSERLVTEDPTIGLRLKKAPNKSWLPYSDEETVAILQAARRETQPSLRWAHWVMALSGMRVGEVLQLTADDVTKDRKTGIWFMAVKHDPENGKSAKNSLPRHVPVHPALEAEGFLGFAARIREKDGDAPLFSDKKPDKHGRLGGRAWNIVGAWVRETVGIKDERKAPNHSWRHRMEDALREAGTYEADRDAILGHARKTVGRQYGLKGEPLARLHAEVSKVKLPENLRA
jgi:integrase